MADVYVKLAGAILILILSYATYHIYSSEQEIKAQNHALIGQLSDLAKQKEKSDTALANMLVEMGKAREETTKTITKLVKIPVSDQEKCVSDVLKASLKEDK